MSTLFGVSHSKEFTDMARVIYPNNQEEPFQVYAELAIEIAETALKLRHDAAVSGAMRWEWSQEAAIHTESSFTMRVV